MRPAHFPAIFTTLALLFIVAGTLYYALHEKGHWVLWLYDQHGPILDRFFSYFTHLGGGWILLLTFFVALFVRYRIALMVLILSIFQGLTMLLFKVWLFPGAPRPLTYFSELNLQPVVDVVPVYLRSFPSGHSMTAFGVAMFLACFNGKLHAQVLLFLYALTVAISRSYLSLHFLIDTTTGALMGLLTTWAAVTLVECSTFVNNPFWDRSLAG